MKYGKTVLTVVGVLAILVAFTSQASATPIEGFPGLGVRINDHTEGHGPASVNPPGQQIAGTKFRYGFIHNGAGFTVEADIEADGDPFVTAVFTITNMMGADKDFTLSTLLPIDPVILGGSLTGGSVSFTLIDLNGDGATLTSIDDNTPIYMSTIDGNDFKSLMDAPVDFSVPAFDTLGSGPERFGPTPANPTFPGPAISNTIGIELNATLSAHDSATIVATFVVVQDPNIPEPATMSLLAIGGVTMLMRRKRRHA